MSAAEQMFERPKRDAIRTTWMKWKSFWTADIRDSELGLDAVAG